MTASAHRIVVEDPPETTVHLASLGCVVVRRAGVGVKRAVAWRMQRPMAADYRAFANDVLSRALHPRRPAATIAGLPHADRRMLMLAVVRLRGDERRWQNLYGASLSTDERFFAVMLWSWEREHSDVLKRLRELVAQRRRQESAPASKRLRAARTPRPTFSSPGIAALRASTLASVCGHDALVGTGINKALATVVGPSAVERLAGPSAVERLAGPSAVERLAGASAAERLARSSGIVGAFARKPLALQAVESAQKTSDVLATTSRYSLPSSFLRPAGFHEDVRRLTDGSRWASWSAASRAGFADAALSGLAKGLDPSRNALGMSERVRALVGGDIAQRAFTTRHVTGIDSTVAAVNSQLRGAQSGVVAQLAAALNRPLFDARTRMLFEPGGISALVPALRPPKFTAASGFIEALRPWRELQDTLAELGEFLDDWESDPLWFLLSVFGLRAARRFIGLTREQVEEVLLDALAEVICDGEFVAALRGVLREAPHLTDLQRAWLDHGLEHAAAGEWVQALPPLLPGLEGALHRVAVEQTLIPDRGGKFMAAEAIIKKLAVEEEYRTFVIWRVFGGIGNSFRHGRADSGAREQVLFAVVALAGWVDFAMELNAMRVLAGQLSEPLDRAIARLGVVVPQLPPAP